MQTTFYIIRHGSTPANTSGRYHGVTDTPLLPMGEAQAEKLKERFHEIPLDAVYASPLQRARRTAAPMAADHGLTPVVLPEIIEMDGGVIEDLEMAKGLEEFGPLLYNMLHDLPAVVCPEGETMAQVFERMTTTLDRLAREHLGQTVAMVSHGCALQSIWCHVQGKPFAQLSRQMVRNTAVSKVIWDEETGYRVEYLGDYSHLPEELTFNPFETKLK